MADDIESRVLRYKSRLQSCTDEEKLQETLLKIADIPITVDILQRTKIGKVINGLRKRDGDLGFLARSIVSEWKSMVARMQAREEEEEENEAHSVSDKPNSSPEVDNNERSPTPEDHEEEISGDVESSNNKKRNRDDKTHHSDKHSSSHSSSHSRDEKHRESKNNYNAKEKNSREHKSKSTEGGRKNLEDTRKSSSDKKQSQSESSSKSKTEHSESKTERNENAHKSHRSHSKTKDSKSSNESSERKESKHHESKHSGSKHSSKDSNKHPNIDSSKSSSKDSSKDLELRHDKHGYSSHDNRKSESRHSSSDKKDKHHSRHSNQESDHSKSHSNQSSSSSKSKKSSHSMDNSDTHRREKEHSSSRSHSKDLTKSRRPKHTLSESDSENSQEEGSSSSKMLGHWDGLSSDVEKNDEPGGFFFNDEYVDHEALLDDALNKYHMEPLVPRPPGSDSVDRKSVKRSSEEVKGDNHSDGSKRRKIESENKKSSSHSGKDKKDDSIHPSHTSHKSKSSSSSKSSSHKKDGEKKDNKSKHEKEGKSDSKKSRSKDPSSFEDSIAAVVVKKPKADPNYEKLKSKFKIKKKGEVSEKSNSEQKSKVDVSEGVKVPVPPSKLRLSQRELASLVRNNAVPNYRPIEETLSAASQFDDSLIGQKSYAKTMVYSGKKSNVVPKVIPLQEICLNVLANHIDDIEAVGSAVPYYLFEPVLKRCTAAQLYRIEDFNPHFLEDTDQLWKLHCEREFKGSEPDEFETYRELYLRKYDEKERKLKQIKNNISQSMAKAVPERTAKLAYIDSYVKPPREVRRQQMKYGTAGPSTGERAKKFSHLMDPIALGRKEREEKAVKQKAPMMQKTMMMLKKMRR
uniref:Transcription elongation factor B polypeptide 3-like n=1 Tax=Crassostrea virginica TaxID=6565 RepID=A0A8B8BNZ4_CRAVI|nr:transcription elongation factor B polypeptide 3-like [Crassostrea virginica]